MAGEYQFHDSSIASLAALARKHDMRMEEKESYTKAELEAALAEHTAGLKANQAELLRENKAAKAKAEAYKDVDVDEYKTLKQQREETERTKAAAEGNFKVWEKQVTDKHAAEIAAKAQKESKLTTALEKRAIKNELTTALVKAGVLPDMLDLLVERGQKNGRLKETDDDFVAFIADEKGNALVADGAGTPMDFDTFVEKDLKTKFPRAFAGTGSSGGGATRSNAGGGGGSKTVQNTSEDYLANLDKIAKKEVTMKVDQ